MLLVLAVGTAALLAFLVVDRRGTDGAEVVSNPSAPAGWKTIDYRGVRVDIPARWGRADLDGCEFVFERWGPPTTACEDDGGVAFYYSATFDPAHGPGARRTDPRGGSAPVWGGWTADGGEYAVYVSDPHRDVVETVLASVRSSQA